MKYLLKNIVTFVRSHWVPLLLVLSVLTLHYDLLLWAVPATGDHMIHLFKGWLMYEHLLPSGRLTGWSHMAFAGYPAGTFYPILGDLLVSATRALTLGIMSWERTYTIAFLCLLIAMPLSVYSLTRKISGRTGAFMAALFSMGDVGDWPQGGHYSTVHWGVWPFMLGLTLTIFSVLAFEGVLRKSIKESPRRFLAFCILLAMTVLAHPMTVFFLGLCAPMFVVVFIIAERKNLRATTILTRALPAAAVALLMTLFWVTPWITRGEEWTFGAPAVGFGGRWLPLREMIVDLAHNDLFGHFSTIPWVLGPLGLVLALISKKRWPLYIALMLVVAFLFAGICYLLGDGIIARKVQIERMAAFMKLLWFALAGYAIDRAGLGIVTGAGRLPARLRKMWPNNMTRFLKPAATAVLTLIFVGVSWNSSFKKVATVGRLGGSLWNDIQDAEHWLGEQPKGMLDRVLYHPGETDIKSLSNADFNALYHQHLFASGPTRTGLPKIKFGYEATAIFKNLPLHFLWKKDQRLIPRLIEEPEALDNLHIRWIVSLTEWPRRDYVHEVKRFGNVIVYETDAGKNPPAQIKGGGTFEVLSFEDEFIKVQIKDAAPNSKLLFPVAYFDPWHAYHDGEPIPIERHDVIKGARNILMSVQARNGITELRYERSSLEKTGIFVSAAAWLCVLGGIAVVTVRRRKRRSKA